MSMTHHPTSLTSFGRSNGPSGPAHFDAVTRRLNALLDLSVQEIAQFTGLIEDIERVPGGTHLLMDHQQPTEALVLLDGLACHYKLLDNARRQMTGIVVPGDFCDYGFLSSSPVSQCVLSLGPSVIGKISLARLSELGSRSPNIVVAAMRAASIEQASCRELTVSLGARDAVSRLAFFLCEMHHRLELVGHVGPSGRFALSMTQSEIGEALGLSTVHVNRTVQHLRRGKLITLSQGSVTIPDIAALAAVASFDASYLKAS